MTWLKIWGTLVWHNPEKIKVFLFPFYLFTQLSEKYNLNNVFLFKMPKTSESVQKTPFWRLFGVMFAVQAKTRFVKWNTFKHSQLPMVFQYIGQR